MLINRYDGTVDLSEYSLHFLGNTLGHVTISIHCISLFYRMVNDDKCNIFHCSAVYGIHACQKKRYCMKVDSKL